ncbi:NADH:flavin oxidoreductase / NADH oxidase family protein [Sarocladium implicatum]|nr:NADH:flavin oxidoreductase / NADH oxidase family protein [Sarocladium implicatum]
MGFDLNNKPAPGVPYYTPAQEPPAATPLNPETAPTLFQPLKTRGVTLHNRFAVSPMCMYSAADGLLTDFHLVHLGQFALRGAGLVMVEATAVEARGRITPQDSGIWKDEHIAPLKRIADFVRSQGSVSGIQIAHAGRKASTLAPWIGGSVKKEIAHKENYGWPDDVVGPSAIPYSENFPPTKALTKDEIKGLVKSFAEAAIRAVKAGIDVIEIHGAHGYLITEFLSPISNQRTDEYGGSFENRTRFLLEIIDAVRAVIPVDMPLWVRVSASEYMDWTGKPSWDLESTIRLAKLLPDLGVDVLDVSSGGNNPEQKLERGNPYVQHDFARAIREALKAEGKEMKIAAVGMITEAEMARSLVQEGKTKADSAETIEIENERGQKTSADIVMAARQFLREAEWPIKVAKELGVEVKTPNQYHRM